MSKIIAKGNHAGLPVTVTCEDEGDEVFVKFDGEANKLHELYEEYFSDRMDECHSIAGNYVPDRNSMLNALNVCQHYFFDDGPMDITVEGDIGVLPFESGTVY